MNVPARYCTGYLGDIGVPRDPNPMDFSAWFEVFLGGKWYTFDARHNHRRIGRIVIARGRDAADVAISTTFGPAQLTRFSVITEEVKDLHAKSGDIVAQQASCETMDAMCKIDALKGQSFQGRRMPMIFGDIAGPVA